MLESLRGALEAEIFPGMRQIDIKNFSHVHTAIDTGRNLATELFEEIENGTFFWITDDYGNLYQYLFDRNSDCFCLKISE